MPTTATSRSRYATIARAAAPLMAIAFIAAILFRFPPEQYSFYPRCPIHEIFGLLCPGCGATRALAALLHGNLREALHLNAFAVALMLIASAYGIAIYARLLSAKHSRLPQPPAPAIYATLIAAAAFTITRNL